MDFSRLPRYPQANVGAVEAAGLSSNRRVAPLWPPLPFAVYVAVSAGLRTDRGYRTRDRAVIVAEAAGPAPLSLVVSASDSRSRQGEFGLFVNDPGAAWARLLDEC